MSQSMLQLEKDAIVKLPVALNTPHAREMLHKRFPAPEWVLLEEVAPKTGGGTRYADAVAVNLWQSRGHSVHGFEIKVSRSDWLRELKQPEKAEDVYQYCDFWWIVAPKGVIKDGELPPTWGLLEVRETCTVQVVAAPKLKPVPVTREFFASLMRRGHEQISAKAERMQRNSANAARAEVDERVKREVDRRNERLRELEDQIAKFKEETGIDFDRYSGPPIETIKLAQKLGALSGWRDGPLSKLTDLAIDLDKAAAAVRHAIGNTGLVEGA